MASKTSLVPDVPDTLTPEQVAQALQIAGRTMSEAGAAKLQQLVQLGLLDSQEALYDCLAIASALNKYHTSQPGNNPHAQISAIGVEVAAKLQPVSALLEIAEGKSDGGASEPGFVNLAKVLKPYLEKMVSSKPIAGDTVVNPGNASSLAA